MQRRAAYQTDHTSLMTARLHLLMALFCALGSLPGFAGDLPTTDIEYGNVDGLPLKLDLYLSQTKAQPLIVYVHGGAWRGGSKSHPPILALQQQGFAIASVDYRLSTEAPFPAQVHDIKAAIRFLRAQASVYGYDASRIGIIGTSAGGHLAALVGVTNESKELEGSVGGHLDQSSTVQCTVSLFGASNLQTILSQSTEQGLKMRVPALQLLLGGQPTEKPDLAKLASPVAHLDPKDPPLLLVHGDADPQMPPEQSVELAKGYAALKLSVQHVVIPGGKHGGPEFFDADRIGLMAGFFQAHLHKP
uniref:Alpha/beta hydrolase fold 3 domain protein n=1 Tax=uncultured Verrucomicrobiota bacterium TaxID=156588 RepID=D2DXU6_9BACT|nr:alpha/beta hydrolase fold 3 domain protein [uncultured Verrucomicrobiota bacterium]